MTDSVEIYVDLYPPIPSRNEAVYEKSCELMDLFRNEK